MSIDPVILEAVDSIIAAEPQLPEFKNQLRQLIINWFDRNASDGDVVRLLQRVRVNTEQED